MSNILYPFKLPLYSTTIEDSRYIQIKNDIDSYIDNNIDVFTKPFPNCNTKSNIRNQKLNLSSALTEIIKTNVDKYYKEWKFPSVNLKLKELWVNIANQNEFQEIHNHYPPSSNNLFSGVLYIKTTPDSGDICFQSPLESQMSTMLQSPLSPPILKITPQNGLMLIFPSYLNYFVNSNLSQIPRISVSFNIEQYIN